MQYKLIYLARRASTVSREDWPRTWRSHAIFASQFPALETKIEYMRYCNRIDDANFPGLSSDHDGVAIAGGDSLEGLNGASFSDDDRAKIDRDELRVFDMLTPNFTFYCTENPVKDGSLGEAALFRFLPRKPNMTREEFDTRWASRRADAATLDSVTRYTLNHPIHDPLPLFPFDGIAEYWFASAEDAMQALTDDTLSLSHAEFCDMDRSITMLTRICHRWPKG